MPKGKAKGRQQAKKKKGNASRKGGTSARSPTGISSSSSLSSPATSSSVLKGAIPNFDEYHEHRSAIEANYPTVYSRYKQATCRFFQYMHDETPESVFGNDDDDDNNNNQRRSSVNSLMIAADWMAETKHVLDPTVLKDLKLSIRIRSRVAKSIYGGGDAGHAHLIKVLTYCWTVLNPLPRAKKPVVVEEEEDKGENRFALFGLENEEEEEEDEELFPSHPVPRPEARDDALTLDELMSSDDRRDATIFLLSLDELMRAVSDQYEAMARCTEVNRRQGVPMSSMVENLIEGAVATNMAIQQVQQLEMELQAQHKHLSTPYRLLSALVLPEITTNVSNIVKEHASKPCNKSDLIAFLGDCIECYYRNASDEYSRRETIVGDFCEEFHVDSVGKSEIDTIFKGLEHIVILETPIGTEHDSANYLINAIRSLSVEQANKLQHSHTWISNMEFIGGERAIHHTLRLLQLFGGVIKTTPPDKKIEPKRGWFGKSPWRADRCKKIHGDLDELLMSDILPQWAMMCRFGVLSKTKLPRENEICPLFVQVRNYVENPEKTVSWALTFAVHAVLTGILDSGKAYYELMGVSKTSFSHYFGQLEWAENFVKHEPQMYRNLCWNHNLMMVKFLQNLGLDVYERAAIWNPVWGGTIFSYLSFFGNIEGGCAVIDCQAQLRMVMYLFHGLLLNGLVCRGQIPMLDYLYESFKNSKAVWQGSLPKKGELVKKFWICFGMGTADANRMSEKAKVESNSRFRRPDVSLGTADGAYFRKRKMVPIEPSEILTCFRRVCDRNFDGVVDKYHTEEQRRRCRGTEHYAFACRMNDTLDWIENEQKLLSFNLLSVGALLEQFICSLGRVLQWEALCAGNPILKEDKRQGLAILFAQYLLGSLDFSQNPLDAVFCDVPMALASSQFITAFFTRVDVSKVMWFQSIEEQR